MPHKEFCVFFSGKLFYKSNRKLFSCVCIAWYKHSRCWENSRRLCKPSTSSRVCITVANSPNSSRVYIRLCKHGKRFLLLYNYWYFNYYSYYANSDEIPGKVACKDMISSHVQITSYFSCEKITVAMVM